MPWMFWASDRVLRRHDGRSVAVLGLITAFVLVGGHIQTSAHVLLATGLYAGWQTVRRWSINRSGREPRRFPSPHFDVSGTAPQAGPFVWRPFGFWGAGIVLGICLAAVELVPLAVDLSKSPVWTDRARERAAPWAWTKPRLLDAVCTALPYAYGSQRRGHPHLAKALGVHNLNESAGGFAGLATLIWLAPLALLMHRCESRAPFLGALTLVGGLGAFDLPPVANVLRAIPLLDVTDNRRLTLWVAFGLVLLGGIGLERMHATRPRKVSIVVWGVAALLLLVSALGLRLFGSRLEDRARTHYARAAAETPGADPALYQARALTQIRRAREIQPAYYALAAGHLFLLAALAEAWRRGALSPRVVRPAVLGLTLLDLFAFGRGLNPAIDLEDDRPEGPVVAYLKREVGTSGRVLGLGAELPPNVLMRYGLNDVRNYDSIEMSRNLDWFASLYEPGAKARTSRRETAWDGVVRARERLCEASVDAVVASTPPSPGAFARVDRVGDVWIARLDGKPLASFQNDGAPLEARSNHGFIDVHLSNKDFGNVVVRETFDAGWRAWIDGHPAEIEPFLGTFLSVRAPAGARMLRMIYDPIEVRCALGISAIAAIALVFALTRSRGFRSTRIASGRLGRTQAAELESVLRSSPAYH
jgi:hypothetical protein